MGDMSDENKTTTLEVSESSYGAEDEGLKATWRSLADTHVAIPMDEGAALDSLNASTAAALLLYEAVRQRAAS